MSPTLLTAPTAVVAPPAVQRILHVINGEHYSGAERVQDLLAASLPEFGCEVGFACVKPGRFAQTRQCQRAPLIETPMRFKFDWRPVDQVVAFARAGDYAALHAHTPRSLFVASWVARRLRLPLYYHVHSPVGRDSNRPWANRINAWLERHLLRRATRIFCVSHSLLHYMQKQGHPPSKLAVIPNAVPNQPRTTIEPPIEGPWVLGLVALFRPRKGLEVLIEALAELRRIGVDAHPKSLGVDDLVDWTGFARNIPILLQELHLMVLPSLFGEGLPMVVLEAMAQGLPVVASRVEGTPEAIRDGQDGLLFEPGDAVGLADRITAVTTQPEQWRKMSASSWTRQRTEFSTRNQAQLLASHYLQ